ncbi:MULTISPECIES: beta strand repeat-containing protein [Bradyrhizobium]|uniref:beta strand repeat-containing protein n=1 Tax=Bradyrhizobium TaxID=374 RepID=UPI001FEFBD98|nr:autotransporter-associated beta strand repeat-containing protein [Bradyrhizobium diazoefficiens]
MAGPTKAGGRIGYGLRSIVRHSLATLLATTALGGVTAHAVDGTWTGGSSDWTAPTNWSSNPSVPNGTATFANPGSTAVDNNNGAVSIGTIQFANTSQAYTFTIGNPFIVNGTGIINNDTVNTQNFEVTSGNNLVFQNSSTASGGAGIVIITNDVGGNVNFIQISTAGTARLINNGVVTFGNSASAGSATITTNNGATTNFTGAATGGSARFIANAGGTVDISGLTSGGMTAGSIEGAGNYVLGANTLSTGSLNTSTQVDGIISGTGGLTKVGTGTLTLAGTNTYTGATTISAGTLAISGFGSISSSSVVTVDATFDISASAVPFNAITTLAGSASGVVNMGGNGLVITNGSTEFAGVIQGTGGIEVFGGTQTLSGVNTYSNATQIDAGATLAMKGAGSIANSAFVSFSAANATLDVSQTTSGTSVRGLGSPAGSGIVALGSKTLTITSGSVFGGVIRDGGIAGGSGGGIVISAGAVQALGGVNTYTGATTIQALGELDLVNSGGGPTAASRPRAMSLPMASWTSRA